MEDIPVCMAFWIQEEDLKLMKMILSARWKHTGTHPVDDSDEDEDYAIVDCFGKDDGSSAEVYYCDEDMTDVADIRVFMAVDEDEKEDFSQAYRQYMDERGLSYNEIPFIEYLYEKAMDRV